MSKTQEINDLWQQFREAIDAMDAKGCGLSGDGHALINALRDYTTESAHGKLSALLGRETAIERQHRRNMESPRDFTAGTAAKLMLMTSASIGASMEKMPSAHLFLTARQSAIEAEVIGYLCREHLSAAWRDSLAKFDYVELMKGGQ